MANKRMEFMIGVMVLTVFVTILVMTILFVPQKSLFSNSGGRKMTILFDKASGINTNSPVLKSGVEIGRVYSSELIDDENKSQVRILFKINSGTKIYSNEWARINRPAFGGSTIEFVKNPGYIGEIIELSSDSIITGVPGGDLTAIVTNMEGDLTKAIQGVSSAAKELHLFLGNLNSFIGTPEELAEKKSRLESLFTGLGDAMSDTKNLTTSLNAIISDPNIQANLRKTTNELPEMISKANALLDNAAVLSDDFRSTMAKSREMFDQVGHNLNNIDQFTAALAEDGPEFLAALNASSQNVQKTVDNISSLAADITEKFNDPNTPLGLLGDEQVGAAVRGAITNTEILTEKVQPILDDARVFSNKIASKPSTLIWGKESYKGSPSLGGTCFGFQSKSPTRGIDSPLFTTERNPYPGSSILDPDQRRMFASDDPNSLGAYYVKSPEVARRGNCFSAAAAKLSSCLGTHSSTPTQAAYQTADPMPYYGLGAPTPDNFAPTPTDTSANKIHFSLGSALKKCFLRKPAHDSVSNNPTSHNSPPMYQGEYVIDGWGNEGDAAMSDGHCGPDSCTTQNGSSHGGYAPAFSDMSRETSPNVFGGENSPQNQPQANAPPSATTATQRPTLLPPSAQNDNGATSGLPRPEILPFHVVRPSPTETAPPRSTEQFVDDGLPLQFAPNL